MLASVKNVENFIWKVIVKYSPEEIKIDFSIMGVDFRASDGLNCTKNICI